MWQSVTTTRTEFFDKIPWPSQLQHLLPKVKSTPVKVTEDLLSRPTADMALPILYQDTTLHPAQSVTTEATPTFGSACATPEHSLYPW